MMKGLLGSAIAAAVFALAPAAQAQSDPRLIEAVRTAQEGASDSARVIVGRLLAETQPTDSLYPEILYTQAMVAGDAGAMRRDLQRVVVEHATSSWADDALLRLVQMDYAGRSLDGAAQNLERLRLDYPLTPLLPQAAYWAARVYFDRNNPVQACRWLTDGMARAQDVELRNQLDYLYQRCGGVERAADTSDTSARAPDSAATSASPADTGAARPRTTVSDSARPADSAPSRPAAQAARFRVQVGAVATPGAADEAANRVEELGYPAVIVRERGLYKVRAGAFATRAEAQAALAKLKAAMGGSPFVVAAP